MDKYKAIFNRFLKGAISGALTAIAMISFSAPTSWEELASILNMLAVAGIFGAINGVLLALQKWVSWQEVLPEPEK